ncbi:hypothetical protein FOZ63_005206 [Perkinsus olseni]|uniref:Uncharacterized protein n=1 Tax=Perkinsus olseni TaxID=32597 RepID=A0A7J6SN01_PEROL|nr:hypothetical protein FOZ63_005206 [Perkinsus olseni]KAF4734314.1 hypothetical protein FOZ62_003927 [Perkinsus olseni]
MGAVPSRVSTPVFVISSLVTQSVSGTQAQVYLAKFDHWKPPVGRYTSTSTGVEDLDELVVEIRRDSKGRSQATFTFLSSNGELETRPGEILRAKWGDPLTSHNCYVPRTGAWIWRSTWGPLGVVCAQTVAVCPPTDGTDAMRIVLNRASYYTPLAIVIRVVRAADLTHESMQSMAPFRRLVYPGIYVSNSPTISGVSRLQVEIKTERSQGRRTGEVKFTVIQNGEMFSSRFVRFSIVPPARDSPVRTFLNSADCLKMDTESHTPTAGGDGSNTPIFSVDDVVSKLGAPGEVSRVTIAICPTSSDDTLSIVLNKYSWLAGELRAINVTRDPSPAVNNPSSNPRMAMKRPVVDQETVRKVGTKREKRVDDEVKASQ